MFANSLQTIYKFYQNFIQKISYLIFVVYILFYYLMLAIHIIYEFMNNNVNPTPITIST